MIGLPPGLWAVLVLRQRAAVRGLGRWVRTPRGALSALVVAGLGVLWLASVVLVGPEVGRVAVRGTGVLEGLAPLSLAVVALVQVLATPEEDALAFHPADVHLIFPAPVGRRDLLKLKLLSLVLVAVPPGLLLGLLAGSAAPNPVGAVLAVVGVLSLMGTATVFVALLRRRLGLRLGRAGALALGALLLGVGGTAVAAALPDDVGVLVGLARVTSHPVAVGLLLPFVAAGRMAGAVDLPSLLAWSAALYGVLGLVVTATLALDVDWVEDAVAGTARLQGALERVRQGGLTGLGGVRRTTVPLPPHLGGIGTLAWRGLVGAVRRSGVLVAVGLTSALFLGVLLPLSRLLAEEYGDAAVIGQAAVVLPLASMLLPQLLRVDLRADLDRLDGLRALPIRPIVVVVAAVVPAVVLVVVVQAVCLVALAGLHPARALDLLRCGIGGAGFALLVVAVDNALFLVWPTRAEVGRAALEQAGSATLVQLLGTGLSTAAGTVGLVAGLWVAWLTGWKDLGLLVGTGVLGGASAAALVFAAARFARFEVGVDDAT